MTISKDHGRQYPLVAIFKFGRVADSSDPDVQVLPGDGTDNEAIDLPVGAIVTHGEVVVTVAFNSGTSDVLDVGDADSENRYKNDADLTSTGVKALVPTGYLYPAAKAITLRRTAVGTAATTGAGYIRVEYVIANRSNEVQAA